DNGKRVVLDLAVGDRILYAKYTGTDVKIDNVDYIVLNEKDVLCKLEV
ncbi:MAG: co-chaperone GroES, partial [Planctomycetota bacterium]|nr:co-chaperone GroES [Planctomycetota bacterium]